MAPKLKVFTWSDGFTAFSVATTSRPKALAAWGVKQDLFATGLASEIKTGKDYQAALKSPDQVFERSLKIDVGAVTKRPIQKSNESATATKKLKAAQLAKDMDAVQSKYEQQAAELDAEAAKISKRRAKLDRTFKERKAKLSSQLRTLRS